jgi:hypothetical protein
MMNAWLANVEYRQQIFITSSHKQIKLLQNIKIFAVFVNNRLLLEVLSTRTRPKCKMAAVVVFVGFCPFTYIFVFAVFLASKIMKWLISGQSQSFSILGVAAY